MSNAWVQRARRAALEAKNRHAKTCQRRSGRVPCGGELRDEIDRLGRLVRHCDRCARRKAGVCRCCPQPVDGKVGQALFCARCRRRQARRTNTAWARAHAAQHRESARESWRRRSGYYEKRGQLPPAPPAKARVVTPACSSTAPFAGGIRGDAHRAKIAAGVKRAWARRKGLEVAA
jgi:hypothetical protein